MVRHFDVDIVGRQRLDARPALLDDLDELIRNIQAPAVIPQLLEPLRELGAGIVIEHVDIQFSLLGEPRHGEVAAAEIPDRRRNRIGAEQKIKLGVKRMAQKQLGHYFASANLCGKAPQTRFILIGRNPPRKLFPEFERQLAPQPHRRWLIHFLVVPDQADDLVQLLLGRALHADHQAAAMAVTARPFLDVLVELLPTRRLK